MFKLAIAAFIGLVIGKVSMARTAARREIQMENKHKLALYEMHSSAFRAGWDLAEDRDKMYHGIYHKTCTSPFCIK